MHQKLVVLVMAVALCTVACQKKEATPEPPKPDAARIACANEWAKFDSEATLEKSAYPRPIFYIEPDSTDVILRLQLQDGRCSTLGSQPCIDFMGERPIRSNLVIFDQPAGGSKNTVLAIPESHSENRPDTTVAFDAFNATAIPYGLSTLSFEHATDSNEARHYFFRVGGPAYQPSGGWSQLYRAVGLGKGWHTIPGLDPLTVYRSQLHKPSCPRPTTS